MIKEGQESYETKKIMTSQGNGKGKQIQKTEMKMKKSR
jgi:hypothetical protein